MSAAAPVLHGRRAPVRVLIADDHPVVRQGLRMMLDADAEIDVVAEASDGDEAFAKAHQVEWDVAVLDYSMPGRGGIELLSDVSTYRARIMKKLGLHTNVDLAHYAMKHHLVA